MIQKGLLQNVQTAVTVAKSLILILVYDSRFETSFLNTLIIVQVCCHHSTVKPQTLLLSSDKEEGKI